MTRSKGVTLVGRRACPVCRRDHHDNTGDNLARYDDGHEWCYRCGYYIPPELTVEVVKNKLMAPPTQNDNSSVDCDNLPTDINAQVGVAGNLWLQQYGLTLEEKKKFWWSESEEQLIYPIFDVQGQLVFWQARNFREGNKKYYTSGRVKDHLHILGDSGPLILVEDVISSIKVSRPKLEGMSYQCMPLFGSIISKELLIRLRHHGLMNSGPSSELGIWLDPDKKVDTLRYTRLARELGIKAFPIITGSDPKCYAMFEIRQYIELARQGNT